jgi:hypothetical protein
MILAHPGLSRSIRKTCVTIRHIYMSDPIPFENYRPAKTVSCFGYTERVHRKKTAFLFRRSSPFLD